MKCGYGKCKLGGHVEKSEGIKISNKWYHSECAEKKNIKSYCSEKLISINMIPRLVSGFLSKMIDDESCDAGYLKFTIDHVIDNKLKITNPYGIKYYMGDYKIEKLYNQNVAKEVGKLINSGMTWDSDVPCDFIVPQKPEPKYLKIL